MAKRTYRVREGFTYGANDQHKAGAILELEESDAAHALDKLELLDYDQSAKVENELNDEDPQALHVTPQASDPGEPPEEPPTEEEDKSRPRSAGSTHRSKK
jgi:hypothetical protein